MYKRQIVRVPAGTLIRAAVARELEYVASLLGKAFFFRLIKRLNNCQTIMGYKPTNPNKLYIVIWLINPAIW